MSSFWDPLWSAIQQHQRFVLTSHVRPDADALGSELALADMLLAMGKSVRIVNPSAAPNNLDFLVPEGRVTKIGAGVTGEDMLDTDVHIIVDTSAWSQLQEIGPVFRKTSAVKIVIDHHASSDSLDAIELKDTVCEATGTLIYRFAAAYDLPITKEIATYLYCAIATDTGWFRFPSTTGETHRIIGDLIDHGAEPPVIYRNLYERRSMEKVALTARVLGGLQRACEDRLAYLTVSSDDFKATGAKPVDTEELVNEALRISGVEAAFIAVEQQNGQIKVSLRSRTGLDVSRVAEQFGGGGHRQASGCILPSPLTAATDRLLAAFTATFSEPVSE